MTAGVLWAPRHAGEAFVLATRGREARRRMAEQRGLVRRDPAPGDRRRRHVSLTPAGTQALTAARETARAIEDELLASLSADERRTLHELLLRLPG